jgi:transglutaminase-like putative cysteine protease
MRLKIQHKTVFEYPYEVATSVNEAWLRPLTDEQQSCLSFSLTTTPSSDPRPYTDYYGNTVYHFDIHQPHAQLEIVASADVLTESIDTTSLLYRDVSPIEPLSAMEQDTWYDSAHRGGADDGGEPDSRHLQPYLWDASL